MLATITAPQKTLYQFTPVVPALPLLPAIPVLPEPTHIQFDGSMTSCHTCPCCSSVLLRHICRNRVYWRCSHCRAPMSVWQQFE
jgi:hypothetical protein